MFDRRAVGRGIVAAMGSALLVAACTANGAASSECEGTFLTVPPGGAGITQLMAHATAMGMTQREAETLIYLEGLNPQATLEAGATICLDGQPD